jgi:hypothetical protein
MQLTISVLDNVAIKDEDMRSIQSLINTEEGAKALMYCNTLSLKDRAISIDRKVFEPDIGKFHIVLGDYIEKDNFSI